MIVNLPLFPGYVFIRIHPHEGMRVVKTSGVVGLVGIHGQPTAIADQEIESLRQCVLRDGNIQPHPCHQKMRKTFEPRSTRGARSFEINRPRNFAVHGRFNFHAQQSAVLRERNFYPGRRVCG